MSSIAFKICLLGDGAVGKTSLRNRYLGKAFKADYMMTIGAEFALKAIKVEERDVKYQIWDLAGQDKIGSIRDLYYWGSMSALIVFDVTRPDSFFHIQNWIAELWNNNGKGKIPFVLLGNKIDLRPETPNSVTTDQGIKYVTQLSETTKGEGFKVEYLETSAKTGENVEMAFDILGKQLFGFIRSNARLSKRLGIS